MEELKIAIKAMKTAEEALAKQGFILRWKYKVKAGRGFVRNAVNRLIAGVDVPEKTQESRSKQKRTAEVKTKPAEASPESPVVTEQAAAPAADEARPVTAFDIKTAAEYLGISYAGVIDLIKRGRLPAHAEAGKRWLTSGELDQYIASRRKPSAESVSQ